MAPAASKVNPRAIMNLLMDISPPCDGWCRWMMRTEKFVLPADYVGHRGPGSSARSERRGNGGMLKSANENLARRSRVQRRASAARVALEHPRGHARVRPPGLELRVDRVRQQFNRPHGGDRNSGGRRGRIRAGQPDKPRAQRG